MFPIILGVAAAALLIGGCSRREDPPPPADRPPEPPPRDPVPSGPRLGSLGSGGSTGRWLVPTLVPPRPSAVTAFSPPVCNGSAPRPERFVIQDARQEFCRLHEVLRGGTCRIEGGRMRLSEERTLTSVFSLIPNLEENSNFLAVPQNRDLREKLTQLEGLQMYLHSGRSCEFDGLQDLMDLMEAYTLYRAAMNSPNAELRRGFAEGRVGCILRRGVHEDQGAHDHEVNGITVHHTQTHTHDAIVTPATVALEHLPADTPVSDCLVVR